MKPYSCYDLYPVYLMLTGSIRVFEDEGREICQALHQLEDRRLFHILDLVVTALYEGQRQIEAMIYAEKEE